MQLLANALVHRGPDGEGFFAEGSFGLAHRRLAIIDLSPGGAQPMQVGDVVVVFNGEIYNHPELRERLKRQGHVFRTASDTEVLARAYLEWGVDCVAQFRGMWAFALFDRRSSALLCARDPFGIKPFYYASPAKDAFLFASEPRALLAAGIEARANEAVISPYLAFGLCDHSPETFFAGIRQLRAGELARVDSDGRMRTIAVTSPFDPGTARPEAADFADSLRDSVRIHLRSDVPTGTCLSGGLDSSTIAAIASSLVHRGSDRGFAAITAASGEAQTDERPFARAVAEHCKLNWQVVEPSAAEFGLEVEQCIASQGEPALSPSIYMQYRIMRQAHDSGVKVMLDGQGGDELLCGYERYVPAFAWELAHTVGAAAGVAALLKFARRSRSGLRAMLPLAAYVLAPALRQRVLASRISFMRAELRAHALEIASEIAGTARNLDAARRGDLQRFSLPALLRYEDRSSMAHSVEARVPYVDREVAACALRMRATDLLRDGFTKYPLRMLADGVLPKTVAWRTSKVGFESPVGSWLAPLAQRIQSEVAASTVVAGACARTPRLDHLPSALRWRLYNLAAWQRLFNVRTG